jgi:MSHA biogenesis protein MshM
MIKGTFGLTKEPFNRDTPELLPQQKQVLEIVLNMVDFLSSWARPGWVSLSCVNIWKRWTKRKMSLSFKIDVPVKDLEKALIQAAFGYIRDRKTLYILIDEAHLMDITVLRKLHLLFERFPNKHNLVLFGQQDLLHYLSMNVNEDIKSRITYSKNILPLSDHELEHYINKELEAVCLGLNTYDSAATELIIRSAQGNLRLCRNLCYGSLIETCRDSKRIVSISHVNSVLIQPHWRSHEELIKQQVR